MKLNQSIIIMNFSGVYEDQTFFRDFETVFMDFTDLQGSNCYCDEEAETAIKKRIEKLKAPGLHFIDSGNYHYVSKIWLDKMEEDFELLVFDHHTDMQMPMFGDILSCGGWVKSALDNNPRLKRIYLAGPPCMAQGDGGKIRDDAEDKIRDDAGDKIRDDAGGKIRDDAWDTAWKEESVLYGERLIGIREDELKEPGRIREYLKDSSLPLYISLDKDILNRSDAVTNWDQGEARLADVLSSIEAVSSCRRIIGADVCGEDTMDSHRGGSGSVEINDNTNRRIVCKMLEVCDMRYT